MSKNIIREKILFKKNDGKWHILSYGNYSYKEDLFESSEYSYSYEQFVSEDVGSIKNYFHETVDSFFPWGKKCLSWEYWNESEWVYPGDTLSFKIKYISKDDLSFHELMTLLPADDFVEYCKDRGLSLTLSVN